MIKPIRITHSLILVISVLLIILISVDTFSGIDFLQSKTYMTVQFVVCIIFILDFFTELYFAPHRWKYIKRRWIFLVLSIPYINILSLYDVDISEPQLYFVRFIPLSRGILAMAIVIGYISKSRITNIFVAYMSVLLLIIYFSSLIFLECERPLNPDVKTYWASLWWCFMEVTTIGAPYYPSTAIGKALAFILSGMGMIMFPLFTVFLTSYIKKHPFSREI